MAPTAQRVLDIAGQEVGYREGPNNLNKYSAAYGEPHSSWCGYFTRWVMEQAGMTITYDGANGTEPSAVFTPNGAIQYHALGRWTGRNGIPLPGDLAFFDFQGSENIGGNVDHVGFVHSLNADGTVNTIEGNTIGTDNGNQAAGGGVWRKIRKRSVIVGFGRPLYAPAAKPPPPFDWAALARLAAVIQKSQHSIAEAAA